jgi:SAM-dependent methyltransferase
LLINRETSHLLATGWAILGGRMNLPHRGGDTINPLMRQLSCGCRRLLPLPLNRVLRTGLTAVRRAGARFIPLDHAFIAHKFLHGQGIEIGALHNPLRLPTGATVQYVDRMSVAQLRQHYPELTAFELVEADILDDGERLDCVPDMSQDFVIANHFLEHCENPLLALHNLLRVLKVEGVLYLTVPDKRYTFDRSRPVTPLEHLIRDFEQGPAWSRHSHFTEFTAALKEAAASEPDLSRWNVPDVEQHARRIEEINYSIHYHVWTQREFLQLLVALPDLIGAAFELELFYRRGLECIAVLRKC